MLILPDRHIPQARILLPVPDAAWRTPSQAQPKDCFGCENLTRFRVRARRHDGHVAWTGYFEDRSDFDAFVFALVTGSIAVERELWRLPTPWWHPDLGEGLFYDFATQDIKVTPLTTNTAYTFPADWDDASNFIQCYGGGASGAAASNTNARASGGGGGGWGIKVNVAASSGGTTNNYQIGAGATAVTSGDGNSGGDTWFGHTAVGSATVKGLKGSNGTQTTTTAGAPTGGAGGTGTGDHSATGGRGGNVTSGGSGTNGGTGGGGAAGPGAASASSSSAGGTGNNGGDGTSASAGTLQTSGGQGDSTFGGAGGGSRTTGNNGTEDDASHGAGGGGGGASNSSGVTAGSGGNYGAGGGGSIRTTSGTPTSGAGIQGYVSFTYNPVSGQPAIKRMGGVVFVGGGPAGGGISRWAPSR